MVDAVENNEYTYTMYKLETLPWIIENISPKFTKFSIEICIKILQIDSIIIYRMSKGRILNLTENKKSEYYFWPNRKCNSWLLFTPRSLFWTI